MNKAAPTVTTRCTTTAVQKNSTIVGLRRTSLALDFLDYVNTSPSPFHAVSNATQRLVNRADFVQVSLSSANNVDQMKLKAGGKYIVTRNQSALIAFTLGKQWKNNHVLNNNKHSASSSAFHIIGAHTDSPCLKLKPVSKLVKSEFLQLGVECYGGGLFHTWFDRDLGLAGRVIVQKKKAKTQKVVSTTGDNGDDCEGDKSEAIEFESKMVLINRPICRIPTLAIHLDREVGTKGFSFNKETHLRPILATAVKAALEETTVTSEKTNHHPILMQLLAQELDCQVEDIRDFELCLFDTQGGNLGGILNEFIFAPRLDNLCCSWLSLEALITSESIQDDENVKMVALFDNEEVGSNSLMGAGSNFLQQTMDWISNDPSSFLQSSRQSLFISADMAHGIHPNYADKHEENHQPKIHHGPVIKHNANERYATTSESSFLLKELARQNGKIPIQEFVVRQDTGCGSTIGPIVATSTGIRTIDVGVAQLSMHSIREMCGVDDLDHTLNWFKAFFSDFSRINASLKID